MINKGKEKKNAVQRWEWSLWFSSGPLRLPHRL